MNSSTDLKIILYPPKFPLSAHLYITNRCNLDCEKCYYRKVDDQKKQLSYKTIKKLFLEWKQYHLTSIAIGGGEPLLHPEIEKIISLGKELGFFMAITTNGTLLKPIHPDRLHISYDEIHSTWKNEELIHTAINYYKKMGCKVGMNHVLTYFKNIDYIMQNFPEIDNLLLIREKPKSKFTEWHRIKPNRKFWIEGCIKGSKCEQGILSFHVNYDLMASICSNFYDKIRYTTLSETWEKIKQYKCKIRDLALVSNYNRKELKINQKI